MLSCTKQEPLVTVIHAYQDEQDDFSRTALSGNNVIWTSSDVITVNGQSSTGIQISSTNASNADFTLPLISAPYYAVSPASCFVAGSFSPSQGRYGSVTLPQEQTYTAGSFDPSSAVMIGKSETSPGIHFRHAMAWMRITVNSAPAKIRRIELSANGGENMSGTFAFDPSEMKITGGSDGNVVRLVSSSGVSSGTAMIVSIPARSYASGITMRVICANKTYCEKVSNKSFTAEPGKIYNTTITYVNSGTVVGASAGDTEEAVVTLTPYWELNATPHALNSHAGQTSRSTFTYVGNSCVAVGEDFVGIPYPIYPRFIRTTDGRWLMFYHNGALQSNGNISWAGGSCRYVESYDMKTWGNPMNVFTSAKGAPDSYSTGTTWRSFAGAYPVRLADGRLMAVAAYRGNTTDYRLTPLNNGLAFRYSSDEGRNWSEIQTVNVGTCWEPCAIVLSSGRVVVYYTDSMPFIQNVWSVGVVSSGVSYIYSDDNGATWKPNDPYNNHLNASLMLRDSKNGTKVYTDQMPGVIELNGSTQLVAVAEADYSKADASSSDYWINMAYSNSSGSWGSPSSTTGELPSDRTNKAFHGCAPTIRQFRSGETVVSYNRKETNNYLFMVPGDETGRSFGTENYVFGTGAPDDRGRGFWGTTYADGHILLAGVGGYGGSNGDNYGIQVGQYFLNHNFWASKHTAVVDGMNQEWKKTDHAVFVGSNGDVHATLRATVNGDRIYFLVEVENGSTVASNYVRIYIAKASGSAIHDGDIFIHRGLDGYTTQRTFSTSSSSWSETSLGMTSAMGRGEGFYIMEFSLPLSSLPEYETTLLLNFAVNDSEDGLQSMQTLPGTYESTRNTTKWVKLYIKQ